MAAFSIIPNDRVRYRIRYRDDALLVVEKPAGVVSEPGRGHSSDSLLNGLFVEFGNLLQNLGELRDWGLLHRLDCETSGLLLVGLRPRDYDALRAGFEERTVKKVYWAIVQGTPRPAQGVIQRPIAEVQGAIKRAVVRRDGKKAVTAYKVLAAGDRASLVEARPTTGRLHQIRVHFAEMGCPVLGDGLYGGRARCPAVPRLCLHAAALSFVHPRLQKRMTVRSEWPEDLRPCLRRLGLPEPAA